MRMEKSAHTSPNIVSFNFRYECVFVFFVYFFRLSFFFLSLSLLCTKFLNIHVENGAQRSAKQIKIYHRKCWMRACGVCTVHDAGKKHLIVVYALCAHIKEPMIRSIWDTKSVARNTFHGILYANAQKTKPNQTKCELWKGNGKTTYTQAHKKRVEMGKCC